MILRLGIGVLGCAAVVGAFSLVACSSDDDTTNNGTNTPDAGTGTDSGGNTQTDSGGTADNDSGSTAGQAITGLTAGQWLWVDFPDSECADGSPTGIGVNLGTSKNLVIYLEGGGACWNSVYCGTVAPQAAYLHGFGKTDFENITNDTGPNQSSSQTGSAKQAGGALDRTTPNNPFKDDSFVYIPYCTGDVHSGDIVKTYDGLATPIHHSGRKNLDAFLKRIVPTFSDQTRVVLTGSSAGGFGAAINYERFRKAFGGTVRMDLIDDSGPPFPNADIASYSDWSAAWDLTTAFPAGCANCATDVTQLIPYLSKTYPDARIALLQYDQDHTIRQFFGTASADAFHTQLDDVITTQFDPTTNAKVFEVDANSHEMLFQINAITSNDASPETLAAWLNDMESDSASWATKKVPTQH